MKRNRWIGVLTALLAVSIANAGPADEGAETLVRDVTGRLNTMLAGENADTARTIDLVESVIGPYADFDGIGRSVLGKYWTRASQDQQSRFSKEFRTLVLRSYAAALTNYAGAQIRFLPGRESADGRSALVRTEVTSDGRTPLSIHYRLRQTSEGWRFVDVTVEGVSLIATYRSSFANEVKRVGIEGLIGQIAEKNGSPLASRT